jgi:CheY-like chemotaxis protein
MSVPTRNTQACALVVDDERDIRELLVLTLGRMGLRCDTASSLHDARALLRHNAYALCLTDMRLADGSGLDLVREIYQLYPQTPVAMITAFGNVEAAVVYSPLSFQISKSGEAKSILDYATAVPPNLTAGWIVLDKLAETKPQLVQKAVNALYGAVAFMRANRDVTVKLIAELYEMPPEIASLEYDNTIMKLETSGDMGAPNVNAAVQLSLDLAKLGGLKDIVPVEDVISTRLKPVPTRP